MKILILEDNPTDADLCSRAITRAFEGCTVDVAPTLKQARQQISFGIAYDIALLDMNLPDGNGLELLTEIREKGLNMAVVVFTATGNEEVAVSALKAGADDYLAKKQGYLDELPRVIGFAIVGFTQNRKHQQEIINVIYIEHNLLDVDLTQRHLKKYAPNVRLEVVPTAEDALRKLQKSDAGECTGYYHLLMLDYCLPGMSALDFIKIIRQKRLLEIPVIIVTGQGDEDIAVQALKLGVTDYITKGENYLFKLPVMIKSAFQQCELIRKQTELAASESKYRLLAENSGDVIFTLDKELNFTYSSPAVKHLRGYEPEETLSQQISDVLTPASFQLATRVIQEYFGNNSENLNNLPPERTLELEMNRKDGTTVWTEVRASLMKDDTGQITGVIGVSRDISQRRTATEELRKLSSAVEQSPESILITNINGDIEFCNPAVVKVSGYSKEEIIGQNPRIFNSGNTTNEEYKAIWETIASGNVWEGEFLNKKKNGDLYWEASSITPVLESSGKITHYLAIKKDISDQKKMTNELVQAKEKAEENDRLKSAFLANMSHEIRTPLNSIIGFSELLSDPDFDTKQQLHFAQMIHTSGNNLLAIISDIMDISKIESGQLQVKKSILSVNKLMLDIQGEYSFKALEKGIKFRIDISNQEKEFFIESDETKLKQILVNLVGNAIKFTEKGFIEFGVKTLGDVALFRVKDTGIGIPKEFHEQIFERFRQVESAFTRKYGGNGLGLPISKALVEMLGGEIWMESKKGEGSTFYFTIPMV